VTRPRVLIVGGGFAGLAAVLALDAAQFEVTLVDRRRHFEFIPNIHELISGLKTPAQLRLPLAAILRDAGHRFRCATVSAVDAESRCLTLDGGRVLAGDYLLLATGSRDADFGIDGVGRHTLALKSVADGRAIHRRLRAAMRERRQPRVVVVGAGLAGLEALGEVLRLLPADGRQVHLVEAAPRLYPAGPAPVADYLRERCEAAGVTLHTGDGVARVTAKTVWLASGARLRSDATLWTGGPAPPAVLAASGLAVPGAWAAVRRDLSLPGRPRVFVAGDSAAFPDALSRQAYHALDMGAAAAGNIARHAAGRNTRRFRPLPRPTLLAFGDTGCILIAGSRALASPALAAAKEGIYTAVMAQLDRRDSRSRLRAAIDRGRGSSEQLWPVLKPGALLRGVTQLRAL
jgi:NADH dehydrogenase